MSTDENKKAINPLAVYSLDEVSGFLAVDPRTTSKIVRKGELTARKIGKGYKVLGENLLNYLGSVTYQAAPIKPINEVSFKEDSK